MGRRWFTAPAGSDGTRRARGPLRRRVRGPALRRRRGLLPWCALSLAPLLLGTGCGLFALTACSPGEDGAADPRPTATVSADVLRALRSAAERTRAAGSARVSAVMELDGKVSTEAGGVLGWSDGLSGTLTIRYRGELAKTLRELGTRTTEARFVDGVYYARMGEAFADRAGGRHWIRHGHDTSADVTPSRSVDLLLFARDLRRVGREEVRGTTATHYAGTVRTAELPTRGPGAGRAAELREQLTAAGIVEERIDVWIDAGGRLVKRSERSRTAAGTLLSTAHYRDFGARVLARPAPPAEDTVDYQALLGNGSAVTGGT
ncbi:hypothetical protein [Streptomyces sp. NPDC059816]|uniref:hypothetical protein n=1 Tax=Streptomyces sp. NPDC059816 TaxID=3346960 RepID=UPI003662DF75